MKIYLSFFFEKKTMEGVEDPEDLFSNPIIASSDESELLEEEEENNNEEDVSEEEEEKEIENEKENEGEEEEEREEEKESDGDEEEEEEKESSSEEEEKESSSEEEEKESSSEEEEESEGDGEDEAEEDNDIDGDGGFSAWAVISGMQEEQIDQNNDEFDPPPPPQERNDAPKIYCSRCTTSRFFQDVVLICMQCQGCCFCIKCYNQANKIQTHLGENTMECYGCGGVRTPLGEIQWDKEVQELYEKPLAFGCPANSCKSPSFSNLRSLLEHVVSCSFLAAAPMHRLEMSIKNQLANQELQLKKFRTRRILYNIALDKKKALLEAAENSVAQQELAIEDNGAEMCESFGCSTLITRALTQRELHDLKTYIPPRAQASAPRAASRTISDNTVAKRDLLLKLTEARRKREREEEPLVQHLSSLSRVSHSKRRK